MEFGFKLDITPKFSHTELVSEIIEKNWFKFQNLAMELGEHTLQYLQTYINAHSHRDGKTGKLASTMTLDTFAGAGQVGWGIGKITDLNSKVPYWRLINFGGLTWAAKTGHGVPGYFGNGDAPDKTKRGSGVGTQRFTYDIGEGHFLMFPKTAIKPMNYIESTRMKLDKELNKILQYLTSHK